RLSAKREPRACVEASAQLGRAVPYADSWAREILGDAVGWTPRRADASPAPSVPSEAQSPPEPAPATARSREPTCSTLSAVLEEWRSTWAIRRQDLPTLKQYAQSVTLLGRLVGDVLLERHPCPGKA